MTEKEKSLSNLEQESLGTLLIEYAKAGDLDSMQEIIDLGANLNEKDGYEFSALSYAARNGHIECINVLVDSGADINIQNKYHETPLMLAVSNGHEDCADTLVKKGAELDQQDAIFEQTALMQAVQWGHEDCVNMLLHAGADPSITDRKGRTALDHAKDFEADHPLIVETLEKAGVAQGIESTKSEMVASNHPVSSAQTTLSLKNQ